MTIRIRVHFLDNLKILLAAIVILVHAGQPYGPGGAWFLMPPPVIPLENLLVIGIFFAVSAAFFMGLFFFISAYFLPGSYDRKGAVRFLQERIIRLGIPLFILLVTILPVIHYFFYPHSASFIDFYLHNTFFTTGNLATLSFDYLWFVVVLILFGLLYSAWRYTRLTFPPVLFPSRSTLLITAVILGLASFSMRIWFPINHWVFFIEPAHLPQYLLLFWAGILASRNHWLDNLPVSLARIWGAIVIAGILLLIPMGFIFGADIGDGGFTIVSFLYSMWEAFVGIGMCIVLLILFQKRFDIVGPVRKILAENIFAVYLIHVPIVMTLQWLLIPVEIPSLGKFFVVGGIAIPLCFLISQYLVRRIPYAEKVIF